MRLPVQLGFATLTASLGIVACSGDEFTAQSGTGGTSAGGASAGGASGSGGALAGGSAGTGGAGTGGVAGSATGGASSGGAAGSAGAPGGGTGGTGGAGGSGGAATGGAGGSGGAATGGAGGTGGIVSACPSGGLQDLKEGFSAPLGTSLWSKYVQSKGTIDSVSGELTAKPGTDTGHYVGIVSTSTFNLDGCSMWVEVKKPLPASVPGETYFMAMVDGSMDAEITATPDPTAPSGLKLVFGVENNGGENNQSIHYNATNHRWWRMRFPAGKVAFDTSPDGKTWTERRSATRPAGMTAVNIELGAGTATYNSTQPTAIFDNLNVLPP